MRWWQWHKDKPEYLAFAGERATIANEVGAVDEDAAWLLHNYNNEGALQVLSTRSNGLATGMNSGYQAVNLAYLAGCKRILLLGYDMQPAANGRMHWFGDHPIQTTQSIFPSMITNFSRLAPLIKARGVEVINCTPGGALNCFRREPIDEAIHRVLSDPPAAAVPA